LEQELLEKGSSMGFSAGAVDDKYKRMKDVVMNEMKENFKPEFINRLDEVIVFRQLNEAEITQIIDLMLNELNQRLKEQDVDLLFTQEVKDMLIKEGYNATMGARNMRRTISKLIEDPLAEEMLTGNLPKNTPIELKVNADKKVYFEKRLDLEKKDKDLAEASS
jgi:ATP-dependent Clp protease ATP-binding subunit ClpC